MIKMKKILILVASLILLAGCEDVIEVELNDGKKQITVDAVLNDIDSVQHIRVTLSGQYFDPATVDPVISANLSMTDSKGNLYTFTEPDAEGRYKLNETIDSLTPGTEFTLNIEYENQSYSAKSVIRDVPAIDSITWSRENLVFGDEDSIWVAQFWATDLEGVGDRYWIRSLRNGELRNDPGNITIAFDGSTGRGSKSDNIPLILPLRASITPGGPGGPPSDSEFLEVGETVGVRILGITDEFAEYLTILEQQLNNGGLFAQPPSNLPTNIINDDENGDRALGWFSVSKTSADSAEISWEKSNNRE